MSNLDDRIREALSGAAPRVEPPDLGDDFGGRARRHELRRRLGSGVLAFAVIGGTVLGYNGLQLAFGPGDTSPVGEGVIAFERVMRACPDHPNIEGTDPDVFAVSPDGSTEWAVASGQAFDRGPARGEEEVSFSPDGTQFAWIDHWTHSLYVTDILTGEARELVHGYDYGQETQPMWVAERPEWSPAGDRIAFSGGPTEIESGHMIPMPDPRQDGVHTVEVGNGAPELLAADGTNPVWSPDGEAIAFLRIDRSERGRVLGRRLFFVNSGGTNERLIRTQPADGNFSINDAEWSPDGTRFVVEAFVQGSHDLFVVNIDGETGYRLTDDDADEISPTWSPDGQRIAFATGRWGHGPGHAEIAVIDASGGPITRLTDNCWDDFRPEWVNDGSTIESLPTWTPPPLPILTKGIAEPDQILFSNDVEGIVDLYAIDSNGGEPANLTADIREQRDPVWSPDREHIAYAQFPGEHGEGDIYVMDRASGEAHRVVTRGSRPTWSPDGSRLAYERGGDVWVVGADGSDAHQLTDLGGVGAVYPDWSPDGLTIVFARDGRLLAVSVEGGRPSVIYEGGRHGQEPDWSPDGARIVFQLENDIAVIGADGSDLRVLADSHAFEAGPAWSPDGSQIAYVSSERPSATAEWGGLWVYVMNADGSNAHAVPRSPDGAAQAVGW